MDMNLIAYLGAGLGLLVLVVMAAAPLLLVLDERRSERQPERRPETRPAPAPRSRLSAVHSS
jgi:hypothetical protein